MRSQKHEGRHGLRKHGLMAKDMNIFFATHIINDGMDDLEPFQHRAYMFTWYGCGRVESQPFQHHACKHAWHGRFGNALRIESLVSNRLEGQSAEFLLAMAELCSLPSEIWSMKHDKKQDVNVCECMRSQGTQLRLTSENFCSGSMLPRRKTQFVTKNNVYRALWLWSNIPKRYQIQNTICNAQTSMTGT